MEIRSTTFALPDHAGLSAPANRAKQRNQNQSSFNARVEITPAGKRLATSQFKHQSRSPAVLSATAIPAGKRPGNNLLGPEHAPHLQAGIRPGTFSTRGAIATYRQIDNTRFQPAGMELLNRIDTRA